MSRDVKWFKDVNEERTPTNSDFDELFFDLNLKALTVQQATPKWFLFACFLAPLPQQTAYLLSLRKS